MRTELSTPIRVIEENDKGEPQLHEIVAIDEETDSCWTRTNRMLKLSAVETWSRPQDDVFKNANIQIDDPSILQAQELRLSQQHNQQQNTVTQQAVAQPAVNVQKYIDLIADKDAEIAKLIAANSLLQERLLEVDNQVEPDVDMIMKRLFSKEPSGEHKTSIELDTVYDMQKLFDAAALLEIDNLSILNAFVQKRLVNSVKIVK
jgi:hypothetical protein